MGAAGGSGTEQAVKDYAAGVVAGSASMFAGFPMDTGACRWPGVNFICQSGLTDSPRAHSHAAASFAIALPCPMPTGSQGAHAGHAHALHRTLELLHADPQI